MLKRFTSLIIVLLLMISLVPLAGASGKMEVAVGQRVTLQGESTRSSVTYKWTVKRGSEILSTQTNRVFNYVFDQPGEYEVNLTATSGTQVVENTTVMVRAGDRYPRPAEIMPDGGSLQPTMPPALDVNLVTLPTLGQDGQIHLLGGGRVRFSFENATGDILEYRVDRNIFVDSDGNGNANDDIDNATHSSYLTGGSWETSYQPAESTKIVAEVTLVDKNGQKARQQAEVVFDVLADATGAPVAVLETTPLADPDDRFVHLTSDEASVSFYARRSTGKILEYRIDQNIFQDSDGDGNPANDIDNLNDVSFKNGDVWTTTYARTDTQIIAQLIVVGEGGTGSRIQRGIKFFEVPEMSASGASEPEPIRLVADKEFVMVGDPILLSVRGLTQSLQEYVFEWDLDGDGETDKTVEADNTLSHIYEAAGLNATRVKVTDRSGNTADFPLEVLVRDRMPTQADFTFEVDGSAVKFTNLSRAASNLANQNLRYQWSFGDPDEANYLAQQNQVGQANPTYNYSKNGEYVVTLTVTDADQVTHSFTSNVVVQAFAEETPEASLGNEVAEAEAGSIGKTIIKIILYIVLVVAALVLVALIGLLGYFKIQHPDLTFDELIDELRMKLVGHLEATPAPANPVKPDVTPAAASAVSPKPAPVAPTEVKPQAEAPAAEAPKPETFRGKEVIETEAEEAPEPKTEAPQKPLGENEGPVPDWLKKL